MTGDQGAVVENEFDYKNCCTDEDGKAFFLKTHNSFFWYSKGYLK